MFIPGCACCGCKPCPYCSPACLTATFSGFDHGTENCNECKFLDDTTFVLKRPRAFGFVTATAADADGPDAGTTANGSGASFGTIGINNIGVMTNFARRTDGSYYVTGVTINNGGSNYDSPTLAFTASGLIQCRSPTASVTVTSGVITAVTVTEGGEYWPSNSCTYVSDPLCAVCPEYAGDDLYASLTIGATSNSFQVYRRDWYDHGGGPRFNSVLLLSATQSNTDAEGAPIPCDGFTFEAENVTGCTTNGTISIASGECGDSSISACDLPEQITLTLGGVDRALAWNARAFGSPPGGDVFDGDCGDYAGICRIRFSGPALGVSSWQGVLVGGGSAVLDRQPGCDIVYSGIFPDSPSASGLSGQIGSVDCGGAFEQGRVVSVTIGPVGLATSVVISDPTKGPAETNSTATAEVTAVNGTGGITGLTLTAPGSGYAREIFTRTEPDMAVTLSASAGTGAVLAATLTQSGTGEDATWAVTSVAVTNGGTGHTGTESVVFTPEAGATTIEPASAYMVTGRTTPTVTAAASGGSGASLSVTLTQTTDWNGLDVWGVSAVSVTSGGTGYTDGSAVTFTVTDGVQYNAGSATIAVGREEPTVTASVPAPSAGTGAVLAVTLTASGTSWTVSGLSITNGGSGYAEWDYIQLSTGDTEESGGYAYVTGVNGSGAITAVTIYSGGSYYRSTGVIESVSIGWGGEYFKSTGVITSVVIEYGGTYFISTPTGTVDADTPAVVIGSQIGDGLAVATATVDTSLSSPTFGQITGITVTTAGSGYKLSGTGWKASIGMGTPYGHGRSHRDTLDTAIFPDLAGFKESTATRVTDEDCPLSLLSRTYNMFDNYIIFPGGYEDICGAAYQLTGFYGNDLAVADYGGGDITCTIAPA